MTDINLKNKNEVDWNLLSQCSLNFKNINRYEFNEDILTLNLSKYLNVEKSQVVLTSGGDQLIDLFLLYCLKNKKLKIGLQKPSFEMFAIIAWRYNLEIFWLETLENGELSKSSLAAISENKIDALILCSPNNPTGQCFDKFKLDLILENFIGPVLLDQAYLEFSEDQMFYDLKDLAFKKKEILILRTFSKAWALAGARVGYGLAQPEFINKINNLRLPYAISQTSIELALIALTKNEIMKSQITQFIKNRKLMYSDLIQNYNIKTALKSETNFFFIKIESQNLNDFLKENAPFIKFQKSWNQVEWSKDFIRLSFEAQTMVNFKSNLDFNQNNI